MQKFSDDELLHRLFYAITREIMFTSGDAQEPSQDCVTLALHLVKKQLETMFERAQIRSCDEEPGTPTPTPARGRGRGRGRGGRKPLVTFSSRGLITSKHLVEQFNNHPHTLAQLYKYVQAINQILTVAKSAIRSADDEITDDIEQAVDEDIVPTASGGTYVQNVLDEILTLAKGMGLNEEGLMNVSDPSLELRTDRLKRRLSKMPSEEYKRFAEARKVSFLEPPNPELARGKKTFCSLVEFRSYLGNPPLHPKCDGIGVVIAFIAKEVITCLVNGALSIGKITDKNFADDEGEEIPMAYYLEALRRHANYVETGDLLFSYVPKKS